MPRNIKFDAKTLSMNRIKKKKVPEWRYPHAIERSYLTDLTQLVKKWKKQAIDIVIPQIPGLLSAASITLDASKYYRADDWVDDLDALMETFKGSLSVNPQVAVSELMFTANQMNAFNAKQWAKITNSVLGVPLLRAEPWLQPILKGFAKENIDLIQNLENQVFKDVSTVVNRGIKQGKSHVTIRNELLGTKLEKGVFDKVETRAQLIARDQIGKLNGQLTKTRQEEVGLSRYFWRDSSDQRVRISHALMDGLLCNWEDSTVYSADGGKTWIARPSGAVLLHPGQDYQCRCSAEPDFSTLGLENIGDTTQISQPKESVEEPRKKKKVTKPTKSEKETIDLLVNNRTSTENINSKAMDLLMKDMVSKNLELQPFYSSGKVTQEVLENLIEREAFYTKYLKDMDPLKYKMDIRPNIWASISPTDEYIKSFRVGIEMLDKKLSKQISDNVAAGFHPMKTGTIKGILDHEYGHALSRRIDKDSKTKLRDLYNKTTKEGMKRGLSEYAGESWEEFAAEGWSEYVNNPNPRKLSLQISKIITKGLENVFVGKIGVK